jgi:hypothetical protein
MPADAGLRFETDQWFGARRLAKKPQLCEKPHSAALQKLETICNDT